VHVASAYARAVDDGPEALEGVLRLAEDILPIRRDELAAALKHATDAAHEQARLLGLGTPGRRTAGRSGVPRPPAEDVAPVAPTGIDAEGPAAVLGIITEITNSIVEQRDVNEVLSMVLEGVTRAGHFDAAFLAFLSRTKDRLVGRLGYGDGVEE